MTIFKGIPGNPAPEPISRRVSLPDRKGTSVNESRKCFIIISLSSVMAVRFIFLFHSFNSVRYFKKRDISLFPRVSPSSVAPVFKISFNKLLTVDCLLLTFIYALSFLNELKAWIQQQQ